ncbi:MAG TPA: DUF5009 domain-containing protein [Chitinophagaceae bacterium]|nr:DUF5009 domain-containing protein [Chitinophagaceae bacterium]
MTQPNLAQFSASPRLKCVDALRGFDMLWIVGGGDLLIELSRLLPEKQGTWLASQFEHEWGSFHFYDIIMPLFLFIVGVVMPVAFRQRLNRGESKQSIYKHVLIRTFKLYVLGLIASGHLLELDISRLRLWTDTLHAIAVGYLVSTVLILELSKRMQIITVAGLLLLYWLLMAFVPVPGVGAGVYRQDMNLALYIDDAVLGHFQEGFGWTYILTNLTFICSVMLGVFAGDILVKNNSHKVKLKQLTIIGIGCITAGVIWSTFFPIIHYIWTSSFVLFAGGISFLLLAVFYQVIDVWKIKKWSFPFRVIGMNAIAVYVATHLFDFRLLGNVFVGGFAKWLGDWYPLLQSAAALTVIWLIMYWMYKTKTFIKV